VAGRRELDRTQSWRRPIHIGWFFVLLWLAVTVVVVGVYLVGGE
jgi:hypothetical protein